MGEGYASPQFRILEGRLLRNRDFKRKFSENSKIFCFSIFIFKNKVTEIRGEISLRVSGFDAHESVRLSKLGGDAPASRYMVGHPQTFLKVDTPGSTRQ